MDAGALTPGSEAMDAGCPSGLSVAVNPTASIDPSAFVRTDDYGADALELLVQGARCAGCIRKIEGALLALPGVRDARLNLSTGRLRVTWTRGRLHPRAITDAVAKAGYVAAAFDPAESQKQIDDEGRRLLRALAVAAFASMNVMMFSVPIWTGDLDMGGSTRTLMHWWSAIIAVPSALYAGQPFFRSAFAVLRQGRANMDVPISLAVCLTLAMSLFETATGGRHAYFDGVCMLLFLLLIGRYLDHQLREKARTAARDLLAMQATTAVRISDDGVARAVAAKALRRGDAIALAAGDRVPVDSVILDGASEFDCAMLTGETMPVSARVGDTVHAGAINLTRPLTLRVVAPVEASLVAQLARLIEIGEQGRGRFVRIADKAVALYVPLVHSLAAATFLSWTFGPQILRSLGVTGMADIGLHGAVMNAVAVLIITCPCALGLAVPAVQVVATGRLFKRGVFVKSGDALERLSQVDTVVLDKTGTLTLGKPRLATSLDADTLTAAAALARCSRHPLSRALVDAAGPGKPAQKAQEVPGEGIAGEIDGIPSRLGRRAFAAPDAPESTDNAAELWFAWGDAAPVRMVFVDELRPDAKSVIEALRHRGLTVELLSGDRSSAVAEAALAAGVGTWRAQTRPADKVAHLERLRATGRKVLMVGDGLNDAAALAAAHASASPGTAVDASQAAADFVFTGAHLAPLVDAIDTARASQRRVTENLAFSALYNIIAVPIAALGYVTPLIAALAMAGSSLMVTLNALRLQAMRPWTS
jgi:P-type Cu2+ transporter